MKKKRNLLAPGAQKHAQKRRSVRSVVRQPPIELYCPKCGMFLAAVWPGSSAMCPIHRVWVHAEKPPEKSLDTNRRPADSYLMPSRHD